MSKITTFFFTRLRGYLRIFTQHSRKDSRIEFPTHQGLSLFPAKSPVQGPHTRDLVFFGKVPQYRAHTPGT